MKVLFTHIAFFILLSLLTLFTASAQKQTLTGYVVLSETGTQKTEPLPYAGITIMQLPDSSFIKGTTTNEKGEFQITYNRQAKKKYLLKASFTGCEPLFKEIESTRQTYRLDTLKLAFGISLKEVVVTAPIQPEEQKGDTTVYNAAAYKLPEGAYLEELVKRIPGLNYDPKTQEMKYNGYSINEITINGEEFFKGNNTVALKNLPASFVSKLQVYDKETEEEKATGIKSENKNYVLDLKTKKKLNGSITGAAEAGYGNYNKRDINGQLFYFEEGGNNFSIIGSSTNRYYTTPNKDNISNSIGTNIVKKYGKKLQISGNINYGFNRNGSESSSYNEQYLISGTQYRTSANDSKSRNRNLSGRVNVRWNPDEKTWIHFSSNVNWSKSGGESSSHSATFSENPEVDVKDPFANIENIDESTRINDNLQQSLSNNNNINYSINGSITRRLNEKGNNLSLSFNHSLRKSRGHSYTLSTATYYQLQDIYGNDSILYRNQYRYTPGTNRNNGISLAYTQVLNKRARLQFSYNFSVSSEEQERNTYDLSPFTDENYVIGNLPDAYESGYTDSLSNTTKSRTLGHRFTIRFNYNSETWGSNIALNVRPQTRSLEQKNGIYRVDTTANSIEWSPSANLRYKTKNIHVTINYSGRTRQPSLSDLMSPTDYSSPLNIRRSNPNLKPSYSHNVNASFRNSKNGISASFGWGQVFNSVTRATIYNPQTGGRETFPTNINGNWNTNGYFNFDKRIKLFRVYANAGGSFNRGVSLINENHTDELERSITRSTSLNSNVGASYLPSWGNIDLYGRWNFQQSKNSLHNNITYTRYYSVGTFASFELPFHLQFNTDAVYDIRSGTGIEGNDDNQVLWNIRISWKFLKKQQAELSATWQDILSQRKSFYRSASATSFNESYTEQIRGYFLIAFKYRFNRTN